MTARRAPNLTEKLAAALLPSSDLTHEQSKARTPELIIGLFELDHYPVRVVDATPEILAARGIPHVNHPSNLTWRRKAAHREKTAKIDIPAVAKRKRIVRVLSGLSDPGGVKAPRPKRRIQSRGFDRSKTKKFTGQVVPRRAGEPIGRPR